MASNEGRRSFLLGVTLNELSFIMFFLLMFISAATLQKTNNKLQQQIDQKASLQTTIDQAVQDRDAAFKRLQLLESTLMRAGGFSAEPNEQQLAQLFSKMQEVSTQDELHQLIVGLQAKLESYKQVEKAMQRSGLGTQSASHFEALLQQTQQATQELQSLKGQLTYMQKKLSNSGLGYPPCWADPQSGAVEYLYTITLYQQEMHIEAAWPAHRQADLKLIPGAEKLAGQSLTPQQLTHLVKPVFAWSKAQGCRHFVRIKDDKSTSKEAFKQQMRIIEDYFYKYLVR